MAYVLDGGGGGYVGGMGFPRPVAPPRPMPVTTVPAPPSGPAPIPVRPPSPVSTPPTSPIFPVTIAPRPSPLPVSTTGGAGYSGIVGTTFPGPAVPGPPSGIMYLGPPLTSNVPPPSTGANIPTGGSTGVPRPVYTVNGTSQVPTGTSDVSGGATITSGISSLFDSIGSALHLGQPVPSPSTGVSTTTGPGINMGTLFLLIALFFVIRGIAR